jgi:hypothetical protein
MQEKLEGRRGGVPRLRVLLASRGNHELLLSSYLGEAR